MRNSFGFYYIFLLYFKIHDVCKKIELKSLRFYQVMNFSGTNQLFLGFPIFRLHTAIKSTIYYLHHLDFLRGYIKYRMELLTGTVTVNKLLLSGTVPVNKFLLARTIPVNMFLLAETPKTIPTPSKYPLVRPQKCQSFVHRLRGTLFHCHARVT